MPFAYTHCLSAPSLRGRAGGEATLEPIQLIVLILKELRVFLLAVVEDDVLLLLRLLLLLVFLNDNDFLFLSVIVL